jgi:hypothetical protein
MHARTPTDYAAPLKAPLDAKAIVDEKDSIQTNYGLRFRSLAIKGLCTRWHHGTADAIAERKRRQRTDAASCKSRTKCAHLDSWVQHRELFWRSVTKRPRSRLHKDV